MTLFTQIRYISIREKSVLCPEVQVSAMVEPDSLNTKPEISVSLSNLIETYKYILANQAVKCIPC